MQWNLIVKQHFCSTYWEFGQEDSDGSCGSCGKSFEFFPFEKVRVISFIESFKPSGIPVVL